MATQLETNISKLQEAIIGANFDIGKSFLPDNEVMKNILKSKNISLTKEDLDIMVDGKISDIKPSTPSTSTLSSANSSMISTKNSTEAKFRESKENLASFSKENHVYPLHPQNQLKAEVKKMKMEARQSAMLLVKSQKDLMQEIAKLAIKIANAISGAAILTAPLSFNVPGAITLVMGVIDSISALIKKMTDVIMHTEGLKHLVYLLPKSSFDSITAPINTSLTILLSLFGAVNSLKSKVDSLSESLDSTIKSFDKQAAIKQMTDQLATKLKELAELLLLKRIKDSMVLHNPFFLTIPKALEILSNKFTKQKLNDEIKKKYKEIEDLRKRINDLLFPPKFSPSTNGDFPEDNEFLDSLNPKMRLVETASDELVNYVYDVLLPDGTLMPNVDEDVIEDIKHKYKVIFDTEHSV